MLEQENSKQATHVLQCEECQNIIKCKPSQQRRFCSRICWGKFYKKQRTFICTYCKKIFETKKEDKKPKGRPFCGRECWDKFQVGKNNPAFKNSASVAKCLNCRSPFKIKTVKRRGNANFCSYQCKTIYWNINGWPKDKRLLIECHCCHKPIKTDPMRHKKRNERSFCSRECASYSHSFYISGQNNGRYVHGEGNRGYPLGWSKAYKESIRKRDKETCKLCGLLQISHVGKLHVHHINYDKNNLHATNLITVCKYCHGKMHGNLESRHEWEQKLLNLLNES